MRLSSRPGPRLERVERDEQDGPRWPFPYKKAVTDHPRRKKPVTNDDPNDRAAPRSCSECGTSFVPAKTADVPATCSGTRTDGEPVTRTEIERCRKRKQRRAKRERKAADARADEWHDDLVTMNLYIFGEVVATLPTLTALVSLRDEWGLNLPEIEEYLLHVIEDNYCPPPGLSETDDLMALSTSTKRATERRPGRLAQQRTDYGRETIGELTAGLLGWRVEDKRSLRDSIRRDDEERGAA
jgi:hypothetical protein